MPSRSRTFPVLRRAATVGCLSLICFALAACSGGASSGGGRGAAAASGPRLVVTARPEPTVWQRTLELGGTLEAPERVEIAARIEGAVVSLAADLGDRVSEGQVLARITSEDYAARVAQSRAELAQARQELTRAEQLMAGELAPREALERAHTKVSVAEAQHSLASRQLRDTRVLAPFDGAIAERRVSPGAFVRVGTPLFVLVATSPLELAIDIPERLAGEIGESTVVRVRSEGGAEVEGRVTRLAPVIDPASRTLRARIEVPSGEGNTLRPGMFVRARIDLGGSDDASRVPRPAVFEVLGQARVVEIVDGLAQARDVELLGEEEGIAIVRGLPATSEVIVRSPGLVAPGTEVRVQPADAPAARAEEGTAGSDGT